MYTKALLLQLPEIVQQIWLISNSLILTSVRLLSHFWKQERWSSSISTLGGSSLTWETVALLPGPAQLSVACSTESNGKLGKALELRLGNWPLPLTYLHEALNLPHVSSYIITNPPHHPLSFEVLLKPRPW